MRWRDAVCRYGRGNNSAVTLALSLTAALLTTGAFVPQVLRTLRTRSTNDLAWAYLVLLGTGVGLWLVYGLVRRDPALIAANGLTFAMVATITGVKASQHWHR